MATTTNSSTHQAALSADAVDVTLGGVAILRGASLEVRRGEVHVLIGPNGAGKTTLANAITGHVPVAAGTVRLGGVALKGAPDRRAARRLGRKFQVPRVFPRLTVAQNLAVAARRGAGRDRATDAARLGDLDPAASVDVLSHGQRQRLELLMVLAQAPEVIVLDEPTAGMTREERDELAALIRVLTPEQTFLVVEHDMDFVTAVADRVSFMHGGEVLLTGTADEVVADPTVRTAYLGAQGEHPLRSSRPGPDRTPRSADAPALGALHVRGLSVFHGSVAGVRDVDLALEPGQTLGIIGRNGAGKSTLLEGLAGTLRSTGHVALDGHDVSREPAWDRARLGIGLVAQGRRLFRDLTVAENLRLAGTQPPGPGPSFDVTALFPALDGLMGRRAGLLSGGEQQQVAIAQALLRRPSVLLLDEPTEGISPIVTEQIADVLERLADDGLSFVLADQHRALVERLCDRFVALRNGTTAGGGALVPGALDAYDHRL